MADDFLKTFLVSPGTCSSRVFGVADYEPEVRIQIFKIAGTIG